MRRTWINHSSALCVILGLASSAFASNSGITYQGRILKPDGTALAGTNTQFKIQIRTPDSQNCLMYEEVQALNLSQSNGAFALTINDGTGSRTDTTGLALDRIFANRGTFNLDATTCSVGGGTYSPNSADGRSLVVQFKDETMATWEPIPAQKINFVPLAFEAKQVGGFTADSILRVVNGSGDPLTGLSPLSNAQYTELLALVGGTSTQYSKTAQLGGASLPTLASLAQGQVLSWDTGTSKWVATTVVGGASSVSQTMIQNGAVSTSQVAGDVTINTTGTLGAAVTTTRDFKIFTASPGTGFVEMKSVVPNGSSTVLTWPAAYGASGQVLTTDAAGMLSWSDPSAASQWTTHGSNISYDGGGNVGIGTTSPLHPLTLNSAVDSQAVYAANSAPLAAAGRFSTILGSAASTAASPNASSSFAGVEGVANYSGTGTNPFSIGTYGTARNSSTGTTTTAAGVFGGLYSNGGGVITKGYGILAGSPNLSGGGTITSNYGVYVGNQGSASVTNAYGLYIASQGGSASNFALYSAGGPNYFAGNVGVGTTAPTAALQLKAGTATAGTAPLKFTSGTLLGTPEDGAIEYDATGLWFTQGSTRYAVPLNGSTGTYSNVSNISNAGGSITMTPSSGNSVVVNQNTASTSSSTGALVVNGGLGAAGAINAGGAITASGNITSGGTITAATSGVIPQLYGSTAASGSIKIDGTSDAAKGNVLLATAGGNVGVGTAAPASPLDILSSVTNPTTPAVNVSTHPTTATGYAVALSTQQTFDTSVTTSNVYGLRNTLYSGNAWGGTYIHGVENNLQFGGSGGVGNEIVGTNNGVSLSHPSGLVQSAYGTKNVVTQAGAGSTSAAYGSYNSVTRSAGTLTNGYGVYIDSIAGTNHYGLYQSGSTDTNYFAGNVGIGTTAPTAILTLSKNTAAAAAPPAGTYAQVIAPDGGSSGYMAESYNAASAIVMRRADTTAAAPSALAANESLGAFGWMGYGSTGYLTYSGAKITGLTTEPWSDTAGGTAITFATRKNGTVSASTEVMRIDQSGNVGIGTTSPLSPLHVKYGSSTQTLGSESGLLIENNGTLNSSAILQTATAAGYGLIVTNAGKVGIGTSLPTAYLNLPAGTISTGGAPLKFTSGTLMTAPEDGAVEYNGTGLWFTIGSTRYVIPTNTAAGNYSNVTNISNVGGSITMTPSAGNSVVVNQSTVSTSSSTGALVVNGGVGVAGAINSAGNITAGGSITATTNAVIPQLYGSTAASGSINIDGTSSTTYGNILLAQNGGNVGVGSASPSTRLEVDEIRTSGFPTSSYYRPMSEHYMLLQPATAIATSNYSDVAIEGMVQVPINSPNVDSAQGGHFLTQMDGGGTATSAYRMYGSVSQALIEGTGINVTNKATGATGQVQMVANSTIADARGVDALVKSTAGTVTTGEAVFAQMNPSAGTVGTAMGTLNNVLNQGATITNAYGEDIRMQQTAGSTATRYGIYIEPFTGTATKDYAIYSTATQSSYFAGNVGIGTTSVSDPLDVQTSLTTTIPLAQFLAPNLATGGANWLTIGKSATAYNAATVNFHNVAAGSSSNYIDFTIWGQPSQLVVQGTGNVGIGTTSPVSTLNVQGAIVSNLVTNAAAVTNVNFAAGNVQVSNNSTNNAAFNICGIQDGGAYQLVLKAQPVGSTPTFSAFSDASCSTAITYVDSGGVQLTTTTATTIITFVRAGSTVYAMIATGFTH